MIVSRERIKEIQARAAATRYQSILVDSEEIEAIAYLAGRYDERVTELLEANNAEVERRRKAENDLAVFREVAKTALCVTATLAANPRFFVHLPINMMRDVEIVRDGCRNALGIDRP